MDKTRSAELSEAINSMFDWYAKVRVCYAFLYDVLPDDDLRARASAFWRSVWFTRSGMLKELVAPPLHRLPRARLDAPRDQACARAVCAGDHRNRRGRAHVPQEAGRRERRATRVLGRKLQVYCLVRLFGVNMPTIYGEGAKAFRRLQEEIMWHSADQMLFAWGTVMPQHIHRENLVTDTHNPSNSLFAPSPAAFARSAKRMPISTEDLAFRTDGLCRPSEDASQPRRPLPLASDQRGRIRAGRTRVPRHARQRSARAADHAPSAPESWTPDSAALTSAHAHTRKAFTTHLGQCDAAHGLWASVTIAPAGAADRVYAYVLDCHADPAPPVIAACTNGATAQLHIRQQQHSRQTPAQLHIRQQQHSRQTPAHAQGEHGPPAAPAPPPSRHRCVVCARGGRAGTGRGRGVVSRGRTSGGEEDRPVHTRDSDALIGCAPDSYASHILLLQNPRLGAHHLSATVTYTPPLPALLPVEDQTPAAAGACAPTCTA